MLTTLFVASIALLAPPTVDGAPVCVSGGPYAAECQGAQTVIQLDGTGSYDPDGTPLTFRWVSECALVTILDPTSSTAMAVVSHGSGAAACKASCTNNVGLEVNSGGEMSACAFSITVSDTQAPAITCPPDLSAVWGIDEDPSNTGYATALDVCDPAPVVTWTETRVPAQVCSGIEEWIYRDWVATDACGNQSMCTQVITLLSPAGGCSGAGTANLEIDPSMCVNLFDTSNLVGIFRVSVMGKGPFSVNELDRSSIRLIRTDVAKPNIQALRPWNAPMGDWIRAMSYIPSQCSPLGKDGLDEVAFSFRRRSVVEQFGLDQLPPGTKVPVAVTGFLKDGSAFWAADVLVIR